ncbi:MAG TPA: hypothetical protein VFT66_12525 [Roseiflexaceae bacterium]|jgi:hypothetical protein|nr:hypothetical protein [Roseiflexaceae bacterium]
MHDEQTGRLRALAEEYVTLVEAMRGGQYADSDEWQRMSSDRTLVHDELLSLTGMTRRDDMYRYCRDLLSTKARTDIAPPADEGV